MKVETPKTYDKPHYSKEIAILIEELNKKGLVIIAERDHNIYYKNNLIGLITPTLCRLHDSGDIFFFEPQSINRILARIDEIIAKDEPDIWKKE